MHYIFESELEAINYNNSIAQANPFNGTTQRWSEIIKHPTQNKWAISCHQDFEIKDKTKEVLNSEWFTLPE